MRLLSPFLHFLFHIGYFGPLVMGVLDSSFLFLPFGNDLLVVALVAQHHHGWPFYVISAAVGSTIGALLLALVSRKIGEEGLRKMMGDKRYDKLRNRIGNRSGAAVAIAGLAPPPFPFTTAIAAVSALDYPIWRTLLINFCARGLRFTILALLALKFGRHVMAIANSAPFKWVMVIFILICIVASIISIRHWLKKPR
jgi:membrane protein YqaA with SNARE-associated domain